MTKPKLEQYPGYYPAGSRPFWSRLKVAAVAAVTGLLIGIASGGGSEADAPTATDESFDAADMQADLDEALASKADLDEQLVDLQEDADSELQAAAKAAHRAQKKAVRTAVARARREERKKTAAAVRAAEQRAAASVAPTVAPLASLPSTDPRFSYCYEANDAGYGPYYQGQDPEYAWYDDRDGDGIVCEY